MMDHPVPVIQFTELCRWPCWGRGIQCHSKNRKGWNVMNRIEVSAYRRDEFWQPETWAENPRRILCGHISLEIYVRTMSAQCPHNISLVRHISFVRCCADIVPTLCGHISPGIYDFTMSALYPSSVFSSGVVNFSKTNCIEQLKNAMATPAKKRFTHEYC